MEEWVYRAAVVATMSVHFAFIAFVIFGGLLAWRRSWLRPLHWASLVYGLGVEIGNWLCPLTLLEARLRRVGGLKVSEQTFIERHLEALIYLDVSRGWLIAGASLAVLLNIWLYAALWRRRRRAPKKAQRQRARR